MDALPGVVAPAASRVGRVEPDPDLRSETMLAAVADEPALDVDRAVDRVGRAFEGHEEAIAGVVDHLAVVLRDSRRAARGRASRVARSTPRRR